MNETTLFRFNESTKCADMDQRLMKSLNAFLILTLVFLSVCTVGGIVLYFHWPWWMTILILLGIMGLWLAWTFFRNLGRTRRERSFIQQVLEQEEAHGRTLGEDGRKQSKALQERWKEAVHSLKSSHLRKHSNPLYALPWYMLIGESGSGKTKAVNSAGLSSMFVKINKTPGISGTRNCDWWLFEEAIILDAAGRRSIPVDEGRDKEEWRNFFSLLVRFRKKEPLNGVVATIGADKLMNAGPGEVEADGRALRRRLDELRRASGATPPVYILVTKCDLIQGMTRFCDRLSHKTLSQAMGALNYDRTNDITAFHERSAHTIGERLKDLRLLLLTGRGAHSGAGIDPGLLLFPKEFDNLKFGLRAFLKGVFKENPPRETPLLRGIYYSSGKQEERPHSHFLKSMGLIEERRVGAGAEKGLFLFDLFSRILPGDREPVGASLKSIPWGRLTRNRGLAAWIAAAAVLCGLLSYSFVKNMGALRDISQYFSTPGMLQGDIVQDLALMDRLRDAIRVVEEQNGRWWTPRLGLNKSVEVERRLKRRYCELFKESFIDPFDKRIIAVMTVFSDSPSDKDASRYIDHLVKRIHLSRARLDEEPLQALLSMRKPSFHALPYEGGREAPADVRWKFAELYIHFLAWRKDIGNLNQRMIDLQGWLKHILTEKRSDLNWLTTWANNEPSLTGVHLMDFWGGASDGSNEVVIPPAYTRDGCLEIEDFIRKIESALPGAIGIDEQKSAFRRRHRQTAAEAWRTFGSLFSNGAERLLSRDRHRQVADRIVEGKGPYFSFLERMAMELEPLAMSGDGPSIPGRAPSPTWMELVWAFKAARLQADGKGPSGRPDVSDNAAETGKPIRSESKKTGGAGTGAESASWDPGRPAGQAFDGYREALAGIRPATVSGRAAYEMAAAAFGEDPAAGASPLLKVSNAENKLMAALAPGRPADGMFRSLVSGPRIFLWDYTTREAACHLNHLWERDVLTAVQGIRDKERLNDLLIGPGGYAMTFIEEGPARPFVAWSAKRGRHARKVMGAQLPFQPSFFALLTRGAGAAMAEPRPEPLTPRPNYLVTVRALPTEVNVDAGRRPHKTVLELHCAVGVTLLINYNFEVRKTFNWAPGLCGGVVLKIGIGETTLVKKYQGARGFPRFLKSFVGGRRTLVPADFPDQKEIMEQWGITHVSVGYEFNDAEIRPLLEIFDRDANAAYNARTNGAGIAEAPALGRNIATCWIP